jgi:hypothetical protein
MRQRAKIQFSQNKVKILEKTTYKTDDEYLKSIKGMEQSITKASNEPIKIQMTG